MPIIQEVVVAAAKVILLACGIVPAIDIGQDKGQYASLAFGPYDEEYIAYYDGYNGDLRLAYYLPGGTCGPDFYFSCETIDGQDGSDVGRFASIIAPRSPDDVIRIAYYDHTNARLKYAYQYPGGNCSANWQCDAVDDMGYSTAGMKISMSLDPDGNPVIAYQQVVPEYPQPMLRISRPYYVFDDGSFGNCGDVPPGYMFLYWRCNTLDDGSPVTSVADYISLKINSSGLVGIAYSEDEMDIARNVKYISQYLLKTFLPILNKP